MYRTTCAARENNISRFAPLAAPLIGTVCRVNFVISFRPVELFFSSPFFEVSDVFFVFTSDRRPRRVEHTMRAKKPAPTRAHEFGNDPSTVVTSSISNSGIISRAVVSNVFRPRKWVFPLISNRSMILDRIRIECVALFWQINSALNIRVPERAGADGGRSATDFRYIGHTRFEINSRYTRRDKRNSRKIHPNYKHKSPFQS